MTMQPRMSLSISERLERIEEVLLECAGNIEFLMRALQQMFLREGHSSLAESLSGPIADMEAARQARHQNRERDTDPVPPDAE